MGNRLKALRKQKRLTLDDIQKATGIKRGTYNNYENGKTEPKLETWNKLADFFEVPTSYLMGLSDDVNGWEEWAKNTGYSIKQIKAEIKRLKETNRLSDSLDIQQQIGQAVASLDKDSYSTTRGVQYRLVFELTSLIGKVHDAFLEPPNNKIFNWNVRKDMDKEAYEKMIDALTKAKKEILQIPIDNKYLH